MRNRLLFIFLLFCDTLFSYDNILDTDIVARTVNFIIFATIMYVLINKPLKSFLQSRQNGISEEFTDYEDRYTLLKRQFQKAKDKYNGISTKSQEILKQAHEEAKEIEQIKLKELEQTLVNMKKSSKNYLINKQLLIKQEIVDNVINDIFKSDELKLSSSDLINIVEKKVSL